MQVYIEYAILDNFFVDYFLLRQAAVILRLKFKKRRLLLSSVIGTTVAVVLPLFDLPTVVGFVVKILLGTVISFTAVDHRNFKGYLKYFNVFLLLTFLLGGVIIGIMSLLGIPYDFEAYYSNKLLPIGLNVLFGYLIYFGIRKFVDRFVSSVMIAPDLYDAEVFINGVSFKAVAFFDSGNRLKDEKTGLPIIICNQKFFDKLTSSTRLSVRGVIAYSTASGVGENEFYATDYVIVNKGREGVVRHAHIMQGNVAAVDAELIIGRALL